MPDREQALARARALVPALQERAARTETLRRLPEETHRDLLAAGLYKVLTPRRYGGLELDFAALLDVAAELGRGCGSTAWVFAQLAGHAWATGMYPEAAQDEVWGNDPDATISSAFPVPGQATARAAEGGYLLDGRWTFASGCDVAQWNSFLAFVPRPGGGPPVNLFALAPAADYAVEDDWFPSGLAGTGSKTLICREAFVPAHRALDVEAARGGPTPGSAVNPGPLYKIALMAAGSKLFSGPAIGTARGALEHIVEDFAGRVSVGGVRLAEQPSVQMRIAEAEAEIDAAWTLLRRDCAEAMAYGERGERPPQTVRIRWRRDDAWAIAACIRAVERLYPLSGGRGLAMASPFQRAWRDVHACGQQIIVNRDLMMTHYGRERLGLPCLDPRI